LKPDVCRRKLADRHPRARKPEMALSCEITRTCARVIHLTTGTFNLIVKDRSTIPLRGVHSVQNGVTQVRIRLSSKPFKHIAQSCCLSTHCAHRISTCYPHGELLPTTRASLGRQTETSGPTWFRELLGQQRASSAFRLHTIRRTPKRKSSKLEKRSPGGCCDER